MFPILAMSTAASKTTFEFTAVSRPLLRILALEHVAYWDGVRLCGEAPACLSSYVLTVDLHARTFRKHND